MRRASSETSLPDSAPTRSFSRRNAVVSPARRRHRSFCGQCGSAVAFEYDKTPGKIHLHLGFSTTSKNCRRKITVSSMKNRAGCCRRTPARARLGSGQPVTPDLQTGRANQLIAEQVSPRDRGFRCRRFWQPWRQARVLGNHARNNPSRGTREQRQTFDECTLPSSSTRSAMQSPLLTSSPRSTLSQLKPACGERRISEHQVAGAGALSLLPIGWPRSAPRPENIRTGFRRRAIQLVEGSNWPYPRVRISAARQWLPGYRERAWPVAGQTSSKEPPPLSSASIVIRRRSSPRAAACRRQAEAGCKYAQRVVVAVHVHEYVIGITQAS